MSNAPIPVAVIGAGRLGRHHARWYAEMDETELVGVVDTDADVGRQVARRHGAVYAPSAAELPPNIVAASVVTPTQQHHAVTTQLLSAGVHCLVEKPLAATVEQAREMIRLAREKNLVLQVGHIERFNPALVAALTRRSDPRFIECRRIAPFSFRSHDVSVVLDLMIHDIDLILHLVRSPVVDVAASGVAVLTDSEDIANARLVFASGCVADVTASRVALKAERKLRVFQRDSYLSIDLLNKNVTYYTKSEKLAAGKIDVSNLDLDQIGDPQAFVLEHLIRREQLPIVETNALRDEQQQFIACVQSGRDPDVTGEDGLHAMEVAERVHAAVRTSRARDADA